MTTYFVFVARAELKWSCSTVIGPVLQRIFKKGQGMKDVLLHFHSSQYIGLGQVNPPPP